MSSQVGALADCAINSGMGTGAALQRIRGMSDWREVHLVPWLIGGMTNVNHHLRL